nr:MAG TPA: hypothetical protein [Caudoviricetes sp.]
MLEVESRIARSLSLVGSCGDPAPLSFVMSW